MDWKGYRGRILEIDMSSGDHEVHELEREEAIAFIGGAGLNAKLLYDYTGPETGALAPENPLIIGAGPLAGTPYPTAARATITAISPLTGIFGDSNGGGFFAARLKMCGYDHLVIRGRADTPSYIYLDSKGPRIMNAGDLWGTETLSCEEELRNRHRGSEVICIGPAGENLVSYASILGNRNSSSFSRSGMGAVMGSKNLKAIVVSARGKVPVVDPDGYSIVSRAVKDFAKESRICRWFFDAGTPIAVTAYSLFRQIGEMNGRRTAPLRKVLKLGSRAFKKQFDWEPRGCWNCPFKCHKKYTIDRGRFKGERGVKHEAGYTRSLGLQLGLYDLPAVLHLVNLCNRLGMDCRDFGGTLGMVIDCLEQGIFSPDGIEGKPPSWGDVEAIEGLIRATALREGFGDVIADGVRRASDYIGNGAGAYALNSKGMYEENFHTPLIMCGFAVSSRGADHLKGFPFLGLMNPLQIRDARELCDGTVWSMIPISHRDKGRLVWWNENYKMLIDCLGICFQMALMLFTLGRLKPDELAEVYRLGTGIELSGQELMRSAERAYLLELCINERMGITRADDTIVKRPERRSVGKRVDLDHPGMLDEYYRYRGLDEQGIPIPQALRDLGLGFVTEA